MDKTWRQEWAREWIEHGEREGLTFAEVARRAGVCVKTVQRWSARLRAEEEREGFKLDSERSRRGQYSHELPPDLERAALPEGAFVELEEHVEPRAGRIEIVLARGRRLVVDESVEVDALARVVLALEQC